MYFQRVCNNKWANKKSEVSIEGRNVYCYRLDIELLLKFFDEPLKHDFLVLLLQFNVKRVSQKRK